MAAEKLHYLAARLLYTAQKLVVTPDPAAFTALSAE